MKSKKWLWVTLSILLTLVVLVGVAGMSFRMGAMQGTGWIQGTNGISMPFGHMREFEQNYRGQPGNQPSYGPGMMQGSGQRGDQRMMQEFGRGGFKRGHGGFFQPLFGLIRLAVLGALLWLAYKWIKNSGWRLTRDPAPAPLAAEAPGVGEKKEGE